MNELAFESVTVKPAGYHLEIGPGTWIVVRPLPPELAGRLAFPAWGKENL